MAELRTRFLRQVVDALERERGAATIATWFSGLPTHLQRYSPVSLRLQDPAGTLPLDHAEELLWVLDRTLGNGSGHLLEHLGEETMARRLTDEISVIQPGNLTATMRRLQSHIERPFVGVHVTYVTEQTPTGFTLTLGVQGRSRSTTSLMHFVCGFVRACNRFALESERATLTLDARAHGDRARIDAKFRRPSSLPAADPLNISIPRIPRHRRRTRTLEEVERILGPSDRPPPSIRPLEQAQESLQRASQNRFPAVRPPSQEPSGHPPSKRNTPSASPNDDDETGEDK